jgi:NADH-quinone oxidoreductase subunit K
MEGENRVTATIPSEYTLILAAILFSLGLAGLLARKNTLFTLISIEVMLNAAGLAFVAAGSRRMQPDGQVMFLFILATAGAEVSVGLALVLQLYRHFHTLNIDSASQLKG